MAKWIALSVLAIVGISIVVVLQVSPKARLVAHGVDCSIRGANAKRDFQRLCDALETANKVGKGRPRSQWSDPERERAAEIVDQALAQDVCTPAVLQLWSASATVNPGDVYALMQESAADVGVPGWTCPAAEALRK